MGKHDDPGGSDHFVVQVRFPDGRMQMYHIRISPGAHMRVIDKRTERLMFSLYWIIHSIDLLDGRGEYINLLTDNFAGGMLTGCPN